MHTFGEPLISPFLFQLLPNRILPILSGFHGYHGYSHSFDNTFRGPFSFLSNFHALGWPYHMVKAEIWRTFGGRVFFCLCGIRNVEKKKINKKVSNIPHLKKIVKKQTIRALNTTVTYHCSLWSHFPEKQKMQNCKKLYYVFTEYPVGYPHKT